MLTRWGPVDIHELFVGLGVGVAAGVFVVEARRRGRSGDARLLYIVAAALVGGAIFMRMGTWLQHLDLSRNASPVQQWLYGNRSILGGLVGAWLGVHVGKKLTGYRLRTGDLFAPAVAAGMVVGRIGCLLTEKPGTAWVGCPAGCITLSPSQAARTGAPAGIPLHPSFAYEIAFHAVCFGLMWMWLRHKDFRAGTLFVWYMAAYGVFRFFVEFVRGNEVVWADMTRPQLFLVVTVPLLLARIAWRARHGGFREPAAVGGRLSEVRA
ncbi:prolipoprotein diacylglyceryl transferase [Calidifontibacter sp. DB0510]|uniref:Prolipoprotein diacylglyceryl transferase n=1 Tax=Metallococcus carri TaxID=1656884 RepID=A0A967B2D3_9MICO|nr:prolipoprotein diacylglyceryl transferase family protein [Metallococcus carri]NHN56120.1 prolipoprotein diacylglyceryl transferase [Metallococcus carri]NOP37423.1 diacylglyceryl transferase [Calidifontibacter sp. DB2511S]